MMKNAIYTIGHSNHHIDEFLYLLNIHNIEVVADVRSSPFSKMYPQYNKDVLKNSLKSKQIRYVFLGKELGARSKESSHYVNNQVQYDLLSQSEVFISGINRLLEGAESYRIAMMCAEKEPLDCHRTILIARELIERNIEINHILPSGSLETHDKTMDRLIKSLRISDNDLYLSDNEIQDMAYNEQAKKIAYVRPGYKNNNIHGNQS